MCHEYIEPLTSFEDGNEWTRKRNHLTVVAQQPNKSNDRMNIVQV